MTTFAEEPLDTADGVLARAHLAGDPDAFAVLYRRYYPNLVSYLRRQAGDHALAEDLAQETLARALKYLSGYDTARPLWPWLMKIARNLAGTEGAKRAAEVTVGEVVLAVEPIGGDHCETYVLRDVLVRALANLKPSQRKALVLRYVEDRAPEEIARVLGLPTRAAVEQLLHRSRRNLAREYTAIDAPSWRGLAGLPLVAKGRDLLASWHARLSHGAEAAMAAAGNVAVGLAIVVSGTTGAVTAGGFAGGAAQARAGDPATTVAPATAADTARSRTSAQAAANDFRSAATPARRGVTIRSGSGTTSPSPQDGGVGARVPGRGPVQGGANVKPTPEDEKVEQSDETTIHPPGQDPVSTDGYLKVDVKDEWHCPLTEGECT